MNRSDWLHLTLVLSLGGLSPFAGAAGMSPQTTVVLINAGVGEGSMIVTNTDAQARLLYTAIEHLPEDPEELMLVSGSSRAIRPITHRKDSPECRPSTSNRSSTPCNRCSWPRSPINKPMPR
ncbi:hypothetical protein [Pseudomonas zeae]|uniref:hypothetical protein n=1 Tax=Pseudomonas zeae TaxID=2745510 RepID=UPI0039E1F226